MTTKYVAICTWIEDGESKWDVITDVVTKEEADNAIDHVNWDGPNMNQRFSTIKEETYLSLLEEEKYK